MKYLASVALVSLVFGCGGGGGGTAGDGGRGGTAGTAGSGGTAGTAGSGGTAGTAGSGGTAGTAGVDGDAGVGGFGGSAGVGGAAGGGGHGGEGGVAGTAGAGGAAGTGGTAGAGGASGSGGNAGAGGAGGTAGASGSGGNAGAGGASGSGGHAGAAGASGSGGNAGAGGMGGTAGLGGSGGTGGTTGTDGNVCPVIGSLTATPLTIPIGERESIVAVDASDPDAVNPHPLITTFIAESGALDDPNAASTLFTCSDPGFAELCVQASDGDAICDKELCIDIECPLDVVPNVCPMLNVINAIPSTIRAGNRSTMIQTRGQETDGVPFPLLLTLSALWGTFENTENIPMQGTVVGQNATYICDRPGAVEICVDATDGACTKTLCTDVACPDPLP